MRHSSAELTGLTSEPGEEAALALRRSTMMQAEKVAAELRDVHAAVAGEHSPMSALSAALRRLQRRQTQAPGLIAPATEALDAALNALDFAGQALDQALRDADFDPRELERVEERLFALRIAQNLISIILVFFIGLALRNYFKIKRWACSARTTFRASMKRASLPKPGVAEGPASPALELLYRTPVGLGACRKQDVPCAARCHLGQERLYFRIAI